MIIMINKTILKGFKTPESCEKCSCCKRRDNLYICKMTETYINPAKLAANCPVYETELREDEKEKFARSQFLEESKKAVVNKLLSENESYKFQIATNNELANAIIDIDLFRRLTEEEWEYYSRRFYKDDDFLVSLIQSMFPDSLNIRRDEENPSVFYFDLYDFNCVIIADETKDKPLIYIDSEWNQTYEKPVAPQTYTDENTERMSEYFEAARRKSNWRKLIRLRVDESEWRGKSNLQLFFMWNFKYKNKKKKELEHWKKKVESDERTYPIRHTKYLNEMEGYKQKVLSQEMMREKYNNVLIPYIEEITNRIKDAKFQEAESC